MPNLPSASKRMRQNEERRARNRARRSAVKSDTRKLLEVLQQGNKDAAKELFAQVTKKLDRTAAQKTIHANTAARRKSRLAKKLNALMAGKASS